MMAVDSEEATWNPNDETILDESPDPCVTINPRLTSNVSKDQSSESPPPTKRSPLPLRPMRAGMKKSIRVRSTSGPKVSLHSRS